MFAFMTHNQRQQIKELAKKYDYPAKILMGMASNGLIDRKLDFDAILVGIRMALSKVTGSHEAFTVEDMMAATGENRETVVEQIEQMRAEAIARGENPDDYASIVTPENQPFRHKYDYTMKMVDGKEEMFLSARGVFKLNYFTMVDEPLDSKPHVIASMFMDEIYKLCAMRKYGKTWHEIKNEVESMNKEQATTWIEGVHNRFVFDNDIFETFGRLKA